jgi:mannonate dehydratase
MPIERRSFLKAIASAGLLRMISPMPAGAQAQVAAATRGTPSPRIKDITVIETAPQGSRLTVVKITTDQDGLHGYGCATFTQRADLVKPAVERYLKPLLMGRSTDRIEDIWWTCYDSSYWKNGPVLNNALSGVDQALWDIKGRQAGMSVYDLVGGKCREAVDTYAHAEGQEIEQTIDAAKKYIAQGWRHVRVQVGLPGMAGYGASAAGAGAQTFKPLTDKPLFEPAYQFRHGLKLLQTARQELGDEIELLHDMHERLTPNQAVEFCKQAEPLRMFFLEDPLSPEDLGYFKQIRQNCATPIAMGELFNSPHEWSPLIEQELIDYIRCHVSQVGGFTPARKIAQMAEQHGVRTAWHGPGDVSPIGHTAHCHLDLVSHNFGIQEYTPFNDATQQIFQGCPKMRDGYLWVSEKPGWGMEIDEALAAKYPFTDRNKLNGGWGELRTLDGTVIKQ